MPQFEQTFGSDPALATDLLVLANSAEFGLRSRIETIRHALVVLGLERVRSLAFSIAMRSYVNTSPRRQDLQPVWSHSIASAIIADQLTDPGAHGARLAYTAALMHDVGRLGMILGIGRRYTESLFAASTTLDESIALEKERFGMSHCEAGVVMARKWGLPQVLQDCMSRHHDALDPSVHLLYITQLACRLADSFGFSEIRKGESEQEIPPFTLPAPFQGRSDLSRERLTELITSQISAVWKLDEPAA